MGYNSVVKVSGHFPCPGSSSVVADLCPPILATTTPGVADTYVDSTCQSVPIFYSISAPRCFVTEEMAKDKKDKKDKKADEHEQTLVDTKDKVEE